MGTLNIIPSKVIEYLDDLNYDYYDDQGVMLRRHLTHRVVDRSANFAVLIVAYQDMENTPDGGAARWGRVRTRILRMQRRAGAWREYDYINIRPHQIDLLGLAFSAVAAELYRIVDDEGKIRPNWKP